MPSGELVERYIEAVNLEREVNGKARIIVVARSYRE